MAEALMLAIIQAEESRRIPRKRSQRTSCFTTLDEGEFVSYFRLTKSLTMYLIEELRPYIEPRSTRKDAITAEMKVLCALNFFASGSYQKRVGNDDFIKVTQQSASNCIRQVSEAMSQHLLRKFVQYPSDQSTQEYIKESFYNYCGIGGILGAIDCTHVAIIGPPNDGFHHERNYVNRKGWHSLNVQLICDMDTKILNVVARAPGCTHDSYIWRSSNLKTAFDVGNKIHGDGWLLGDAGYRQERHLHVPIEGALPGSDEERYNKAHAKGRCVIEWCNGILKNRFRCLLKDRTLHYLPEAAAHITNSCVILHNLCVMDSLYWDEVDLDQDNELFDTVEDDD